VTGDYEAGDINTIAGAGEADEEDEDLEYEEGDINARGGGDAHDDTGDESEGSAPVAVLTYIARSLADEPDSVVVETERRRGTVVLRVHLAPEDMGRVIGRRGRTAQAIRTLVAAAGAREGAQVSVDIVDD
jgi:predicted RNA-binding protein YlqC (UPF0109 family)